MSKSSLHGYAEVHFDVMGCSIKNDIDIFEKAENQRVFLDRKVPKKMILSQSRIYMAMQACILMLRVGAQKSI